MRVKKRARKPKMRVMEHHRGINRAERRSKIATLFRERDKMMKPLMRHAKRAE